MCNEEKVKAQDAKVSVPAEPEKPILRVLNENFSLRDKKDSDDKDE